METMETHDEAQGAAQAADNNFVFIIFVCRYEIVLSFKTVLSNNRKAQSTRLITAYKLL